MERPGEAREGDDRLTGCERGYVSPENVTDAADGAPETVHDTRVADLVEDPVVNEPKDFVGEMLWQLSNEDESEPAFTTPPGDARHLLEEDFHLLNAPCRQELVGFFDKYQCWSWLAPLNDSRSVT